MNRSSFLWEPAARRLPVASLLFVVFALAVNVVPGVADWLQFDRHAIARGELWRLVTSHYVHCRVTICSGIHWLSECSAGCANEMVFGLFCGALPCRRR
jgi:hypothetical protein